MSAIVGTNMLAIGSRVDGVCNLWLLRANLCFLVAPHQCSNKDYRTCAAAQLVAGWLR